MALEAILKYDPDFQSNFSLGGDSAHRTTRLLGNFPDFIFIYVFFFYMVIFLINCLVYICNLLLSLIIYLIYSLIILFSMLIYCCFLFI